MSDSTACIYFSEIFAWLAMDPEKYKEAARFIYAVCREIDFHPCELELDDALIAWGLAKVGPNPDYERYPEYEDEEIVLYLGVDYGKYPKRYY